MSQKTIKVISAPLKRPPREASQLTSNGGLLAAWQYWGMISGENDAKYHFALHSPAWGWRGYLWNEQLEPPCKIFLAPPDAVWVYVGFDNLMRLQIEQHGEMVITNTGVKIYDLLYANERGCLVKASMEIIENLHFNQGRLSRTELYTGEYPEWAYFLSDGSIALYDSDRLIVLSLGGNKLYEEKVTSCYCFPPFIIRYSEDHLYYTDDPREGWREVRNFVLYGDVKLFTITGDECYIAFESELNKTYRYRLLSQSSESVELVFKAKRGYSCDFVQHGRFVCVISENSISGYDTTTVPQNDGLLVWDPVVKAFYTDIPRTVNMQKVSAGQIPNICIPDIWGRDTQQQ